MYYRVKNFEKFQHYKDRNPPWIKLHRALLDDYEFAKLPDLSKAHLMLIWLLASQLEGRIPDDPEFVREKIGSKKPPDLAFLAVAGWLIPEPIAEPAAVAVPEQNASDALAPCKQDASNVLALAHSREERRTASEDKSLRGEGATPKAEVPTAGHRDLAKKYGLDCGFEWDKFKDHDWKGKDPPKDLNKGFRNWLHKAHEFAVRDGKSEDRLDYGHVL